MISDTTARMLKESRGLGVTPAELERIMDMVKQAADAHPGAYGIDPDGFEKDINPKLAQYGIEFTRTNDFLNRYNAPACTLLSGVIARTPSVNSPAYMHQLKVTLSHELVHQSQIDHAIHTGNAYKMMASAQNRSMPGGKLDREKYMTDKHEIGAYARTALDSAGIKTQDKALRTLRNKSLPWLSQEPKGSDLWKRSRKAAYKHATTTLEAVEEVPFADPEELLSAGDNKPVTCPQCKADLKQPESVIRLYRHQTALDDEPSCGGHYEGAGNAETWVADQPMDQVDIDLFYAYTDACADCGNHLATAPIQKD